VTPEQRPPFLDGDAAGAGLPGTQLLHALAMECDASAAGTELWHSLGLVLAAAMVTRLTEAPGVKGRCRFTADPPRRVRIGVSIAATNFALLCICAFEVFETVTGGCIFRSISFARPVSQPMLSNTLSAIFPIATQPNGWDSFRPLLITCSLVQRFSNNSAQIDTGSRSTMPHERRLGKDYSQRAGSTLRSAIVICIGSSMDARPLPQCKGCRPALEGHPQNSHL
jgi:hypothetical protein